MNFDTLEEEFSFYSSISQWQMIFGMFGNTKIIESKKMSEIVTAIVAAVAGGAVNAEAIKNYENLKKIVESELFKNFLFKITEKAQSSGELIIRNLRSFNSLRMALVFSEVYKILKEKGVSEPEAIAEKILMPAIQSISENEDIDFSSNIRSKWANLLSNMSLGKGTNNKTFITILDEIEHKDAVILDIIYKKSRNIIFTHHGNQSAIKVSKIKNNSSFNKQEIEESVDILRSKNLCDYNMDKKNLNARVKDFKEERIVLTTNFGKLFFNAVSLEE